MVWQIGILRKTSEWLLRFSLISSPHNSYLNNKFVFKVFLTEIVEATVCIKYTTICIVGEI